MDEEKKKKPSLVALLDRTEQLGKPPAFLFPQTGTMSPLSRHHRDPHPVVLLTVVALSLTLCVGVVAYYVWQHVQNKKQPHVPLKTMPMVVIDGRK